MKRKGREWGERMYRRRHGSDHDDVSLGLGLEHDFGGFTSAEVGLGVNGGRTSQACHGREQSKPARRTPLMLMAQSLFILSVGYLNGKLQKRYSESLGNDDRPPGS